MIPFLVLTMLDIIVAGAGGIVVVVALFYANVIPGRIFDAISTRVADPDPVGSGMFCPDPDPTNMKINF